MPLVTDVQQGGYPHCDNHDGDSIILSSSVAYHETLTEQHKQLRPVVCQDDIATTEDHISRGQTLRSWIPFGARAPGGAPTSMPSDGLSSTAARSNKSSGEMRIKPACGQATKGTSIASDNGPTPSAVPLALYAAPTRMDIEEYEALPLAIQRKVSLFLFYFIFLHDLQFFFGSPSPLVDQHMFIHLIMSALPPFHSAYLSHRY